MAYVHILRIAALIMFPKLFYSFIYMVIHFRTPSVFEAGHMCWNNFKNPGRYVISEAEIAKAHRRPFRSYTSH
jgi:hypothetical protein